MPILLKDFDWTQNHQEIILVVPIKGILSSKTNIYTDSLLVKIHFSPFLFELDLNKEIIPDDSMATIGNGQVKLVLKKKEPEMWDNVKFEHSDPTFIRERREKAMTNRHEEIELKRRQKLEKDAEHQRYLTSKLIDLEQKERAEIMAKKEDEKRAFEKAMFEDREWTGEVAKAAEAPISNEKELYLDSDSDCESGLDMTAILAKVQQQMNAHTLKASDIRPSSEIIVDFTSRKNMLSTVARESEDAKYLATLNAMKQQAAAREVKGRIELPPEDDQPNMTPVLLKQKGDQWFAQGNFESAINAYSTALGKDPSLLSALSNRSAAYLKLQKLKECIQDCDSGLSIIEAQAQVLEKEHLPLDTQNKAFKVKFLVRKGAAYHAMGQAHHTVQYYQSALDIDPQNHALKADLKQLMESV